MVAHIARVDLRAAYADGAEVAETTVDYWLGIPLRLRADPAALIICCTIFVTRCRM